MNVANGPGRAGWEGGACEGPEGGGKHMIRV